MLGVLLRLKVRCWGFALHKDTFARVGAFSLDDVEDSELLKVE